MLYMILLINLLYNEKNTIENLKHLFIYDVVKYIYIYIKYNKTWTIFVKIIFNYKILNFKVYFIQLFV